MNLSFHFRPDFEPAIPKNAIITYEVEILSVTKGTPPSEMEAQDCISFA